MSATGTAQMASELPQPGKDAVAAIHKQRWGLYLTVFMAGAVFLGVEMAGSRILAPNFGNSIYVWGGLIGQFMAAYAAGAFFGGRLADKWPSYGLLMLLVIVGGFLTCTVIPILGPGICTMVAGIWPNDAGGPLFAAIVLFFLPSLLMATAPPYAIKLCATSLKDLGTVAGKLSSLYTFGSIVGAILTTFFLIPYIGVDTIFYMIGLALVASGVAGLVIGKLK